MMDGDSESSINISSAQFALSNFSNPVDGNSFKSLNEILINFKKKHNAWLEAECLFHTNEEIQVFYGLIIMNDLIKHRWYSLTNDQRDCISTFIMGKTIKLATSSNLSSSEETLLQKFNQSLIELFFIKWDRNEWPNLISNIIQSSYTNEQLCQNNFLLLKLLYQLIYQDSWNVNMHHSKLIKLRRLFSTNYFDKIFKLLMNILEISKNICLVQRSLELLDLFMELKFDISQEADKIFGFLSNLLLVSVVRKECIKTVSNFMNYSKNSLKLVTYYKKVLQQLIKVIPSSFVVREEYQQLEPRDQVFLSVLTDVLAEHTPLLYPGEASNTAHDPRLEDAWLFLLRLTAVEPRDLQDSSSIRTIALQYWSQLSSSILHTTTTSTDSSAFTCKAMVYLKEVSELVMVNCSSSELDGLIVHDEKSADMSHDVNESLLLAIQNMFRNYFLLNSKSAAEQIQSKFSDLLTSPNVPIKQLYSLCRSIEFVLLSDQVRRQLKHPLSSTGKQQQHEENDTSVTETSWSLRNILLELLRFSINSLLTLQNQMLTFRDQVPICCGIVHLLGCFSTLSHLHPFLTRVITKRLCVYLGVNNEVVKEMVLGSLRKWALYSPGVFTELPPQLLSASSPKLQEPVDIFNRLISEVNSKSISLNHTQIVLLYDTLALVITSIIPDHNSNFTNDDNKDDNDSELYCKQNHFISILYRSLNHGWSELMRDIHHEVWKLLDTGTTNLLLLIVSTNTKICRTLKSMYLMQLAEILPDTLDLMKLVSTSLYRIRERLSKSHSPGDFKSIQGIAQLVRLRQTLLEFIRVFVSEITWSGQTYLELTSVLVPLLTCDLSSSSSHHYYHTGTQKSRDDDIDRDVCLHTLRVIIDKAEIDTVCVSSILKCIVTTISSSTSDSDNAVDKDNSTHYQALLLIHAIMRRYSNDLLNDANLLPFSRLIQLLDYLLWNLKSNLLELRKVGYQVLESVLQYYESGASNSHQRKKFIRQFYIHVLHNVLLSAIEAGCVYEESGLISVVTILLSWISIDKPLCHFRWSRHHHSYQKRPSNIQLMEGNTEYVVKATSQFLNGLHHQLCEINIRPDVFHTEFIRDLIKACSCSSKSVVDNIATNSANDGDDEDGGKIVTKGNNTAGNCGGDDEKNVLVIFRDYMLTLRQEYNDDDDEDKRVGDDDDDDDDEDEERNMVIG